ncbi:MAG: tetratricopeptide repeat protein [Armatimonadetes bacterium]|nr:tetratricopeptide repeat protein [Armatimonadota bacterium]
MGMPTGTVTFLFTDIEGSTKLWDAYPDAMRGSLSRHDEIMREQIAAHDGYVFKTIGDAFCAAFFTAPDALNAALAAQLAFVDEPWQTPSPIRVRMALHTGTAQVRDNDYFGQPLNRVSRLQGAGHGGQTLMSLATQELVRDSLLPGVALLDLGIHQLRDLARPETVFQLCHPRLTADFAPIKTLDNPALRHNLPTQATSFVGRETEVAEVKRLLETTRLLTLTGTGGAGKTRLSLQVAADEIDGVGDGVWLVELAPLSDGDGVAQAVAKVLFVKEVPGESLLDTLVRDLRPKKLLLLLDNCEHVLPAISRLADALLKNCPDVRLLATSRESLQIGGETLYRVPSLPLPDPAEAPTAQNVGQYEAVRLFIDRAIASKPAFAVTNANAPAVAQICSRLDGIPLALELAAARIKSLSAEEINTRLDQSFRLLTGGSRTALPRQQTLRALVDWSYDLLSSAEKTLLSRLSVFAGGWTVEAAESVCAGDPVEGWEVLDLLSTLSDKSLVVSTDTPDGQTRYRLLETIRQYARERLQADFAPMEAVQAAHLLYFSNRADSVEELLFGAEAARYLAELETEHDNIRAALRFGIASQTLPEELCRLCAAGGQLWHFRGYWNEGRKWCAEIIAATQSAKPLPASARRAKVYTQAGRYALFQGDLTDAEASLQTARALAAQVGDDATLSLTLNTLGNVFFDRNDLDAAEGCYREALTVQPRLLKKDDMTHNLLSNLGGVAQERGEFAVARGLHTQALAIQRANGDKPSIAVTLENLAVLAVADGDLGQARALCEEAVQLNRDAGNKPDTAYSLRALGEVALEAGNAPEAREHLIESLQTAREVGARVLAVSVMLPLARACLLCGDASQAAHLLGTAQVLLETLTDDRNAAKHAQDAADTTAQTRAALGDAAFAAAFATGQADSF